MRTAVFITARTGSTRLPGKALLEVSPGVPAVLYLIRRMKSCRRADQIVLCTTEAAEDDVLCQFARQEGIECFRGSAEDKLARWQGAAHRFGVDFFVTADGDDLFCDPELIDQAFQQASSDTPDFLEAPDLACGAFTYGIKVRALDRVCEIKDSTDTEMMWVYFKETKLFRVATLRNVDPLFVRPRLRLTLDYEDDLRFFRAVIAEFEGRGQPYGLRDIIRYLDAHPELPAINWYLQERFLANQARRTTLKLKTTQSREPRTVSEGAAPGNSDARRA
jgi:spore coat polysaccharide biosynthesis protein SpsF